MFCGARVFTPNEGATPGRHAAVVFGDGPTWSHRFWLLARTISDDPALRYPTAQGLPVVAHIAD